VVFTLAGLGCQQADFGEAITVPVGKRMRFAANAAQNTTITIPAEERFNLVAAQRRSTNDCQSASFARADGTASCSIKVGSTGNASAEFQLGHVLHHDGTKKRGATIHFDCDYSYEVAGADGPPAFPKTLALKLYVRDSKTQTVHKELLVSHNDAQGARRQSGIESPSFDLTLEPGNSYNLVLAAMVEGKAGGGQTSYEARIDVKRFEVQIRFRDANESAAMAAP
jgi:hypothetical protein